MDYIDEEFCFDGFGNDTVWDGRLLSYESVNCEMVKRTGKGPRQRLPAVAKDCLNRWLMDNHTRPYMSSVEMSSYAEVLGLTAKQVGRYLLNGRSRLLKRNEVRTQTGSFPWIRPKNMTVYLKEREVELLSLIGTADKMARENGECDTN